MFGILRGSVKYYGILSCVMLVRKDVAYSGFEFSLSIFIVKIKQFYYITLF